jgi:hypothetical protein
MNQTFDNQGRTSMPIYDGTGPGGTGSRTERGMGRRNQGADKTTPTVLEDPALAAALLDRVIERGYWPWPGGPGRGLPGGRRRRGRGLATETPAIDEPADPGAQRRQHEAFLRLRIETLTAELDRTKELLSKCSPADEPSIGLGATRREPC